MAYDSVLDREMFRPKSRGIVSLDDTNESEDLRSRREKAMAMMNAAKEKFDPKNFQTLTEQDRPGVFRPVAVNMPAQQQTADTAMRMQQMAAQGIRPVGFEEGGLATVKQWIESGFGLENVIPGLKEFRQRNSERLSPTVSSPELTENAPEDSDLPTPAELNMDRPLTDEEKENIRRSRKIFETVAPLGPAVKGIRALEKGAKPKPAAPSKKPAAQKEPPKPGDPDFVGPTAPPKPGDPNFVGPTFPKPGDPNFVGPSQPPVTSVPQVPQRPPGQLPPRPAGLVDRAASSAAQTANLGQSVSGGIAAFNPGRGNVVERPGERAAWLASHPDKKPESPSTPKIKSGGGDKETPAPTNLSDIKRSREEAFNTALMMAGLGMMAGKSSNALANIGEGGIMGLKAYTDQLAQDRARAAEERKLDLTEKYYGIQEKRYNEAQALREANLKKAYALAMQQGEEAADKAYNQWLQAGTNATLGEELKAAKLDELRKKYTNMFYNRNSLGVSMGSSDPLGLGISSPEE